MRIGIYLGSFKPMHLGHEQTLIQAVEQNDVLLFFPGFGAKGVKKGKRKNPLTGAKEDFYRPVDDQVMMTDDLGEYQFKLIKFAIERIKSEIPDSPLNKVKIVMPGDVINSYEAATGPLASALMIVGEIADHYVNNSGSMIQVYIPFLDESVDNPQIRLYSDVSDVSRVTPKMLERFKVNPEGIAGIYMKNFIPVGIERDATASASPVDYEYERASFETENVSATQLRNKIRSLENLTGDALVQAKEEIKALMPAMLSDQEKEDLISKASELDRTRRAAGGIFKSDLEMLQEIKRATKGTPEYSAYLDDLMDELRYVKSSYQSRKKEGKQYRK